MVRTAQSSRPLCACSRNRTAATVGRVPIISCGQRGKLTAAWQDPCAQSKQLCVSKLEAGLPTCRPGSPVICATTGEGELQRQQTRIGNTCSCGGADIGGSILLKHNFQQMDTRTGSSAPPSARSRSLHSPKLRRMLRRGDAPDPAARCADFPLQRLQQWSVQPAVGPGAAGVSAAWPDQCHAV